MILIRTNLTKNWLREIGRNQDWLAAKLGVSKGYMSQVINNQIKMTIPFIDQMLILTNMPFEKLFYHDGTEDRRKFWSKEVSWEGNFLRRHKYQMGIKEILKKEDYRLLTETNNGVNLDTEDEYDHDKRKNKIK